MKAGRAGKTRAVKYRPKPIDTSSVTLPPALRRLTELLAKNTHMLWAAKRLRDGWVCGEHRDDRAKTHPNLVPYHRLKEDEKEYDRATAMEAIKVIMALGYRISKDGPPKRRPRRKTHA